MTTLTPIHQPVGDFASRLRERRDTVGLKLDDAAYLARRTLPDSMPVSRETIRRYETGKVAETDANPFYIAALAVVYGCKVSDLSPIAAEGIRVIYDQIIETLKPDPDRPDGGGATDVTGWYLPLSRHPFAA